MKKILIIEDEISVRAILYDLFAGKGYKPITASDGREGIELAKQDLPDLIISDIMMPEVDGYAVKTELYKHKATAHIPFIFLSAKTDFHDIRFGMELGADDYISKPFKASDLLKAVQVRITKHESLINYLAAGKESNSGLQDVTRQSKYGLSDYIFVDFKSKSQFVRIGEIACITAENEYSEIYTENGMRFLFRRALSRWENILPENNFVRIHRGTIINVEHIERMEKYSSRTIKVWLKNIKKEVVISQRYASKLRMPLNNQL